LKQEYSGIEVFYQSVDLGQKEEVYGFAQAVKVRWKKVDVLINNAGWFSQGEMLEEGDEVMEDMMKINFFAPYYLTKALVAGMLEQGGGHIFNVCSIASRRAYPGSGAYTTTKFALYGFTRSLREDLKGKNIRVTAVLPGATWTNSWAGASLPEDRLMPPEAVAQAIYNAAAMPGSAVVEEIVLRPQEGDLM